MQVEADLEARVAAEADLKARVGAEVEAEALVEAEGETKTSSGFLSDEVEMQRAEEKVSEKHGGIVQ